MAAFVETMKKWYEKEIGALDRIKPLFLLVLRLYFGWGFMAAGLGKLFDVETHTGFFKGWGIPLPEFNVYMAGTTETVCGLLLLLGAASRLIAIPLIGTMLVAYLTAHSEQFYALFDNNSRAIFFKAPPFPYLFTCLVVLLFGPGWISIDGLVKAVLECKNHDARRPADAVGSPVSHHPDKTSLS